MGKRSDFPRRKNDAYMTPLAPVLKLLPHLPAVFTFVEPCAGDGRLIRHIEENSGGICTSAYDIEPLARGIARADAMNLVSTESDFFITNPPWTRQILHPMILHLSTIAPTWLLYDADWAHTKQAAPYLPYCQKIVAVGRVSWMENGVSGLDNAAWYLFDRADYTVQTEFFGVAA